MSEELSEDAAAHLYYSEPTTSAREHRMSLCYELVRVVVNREAIEVRCHLPFGHLRPHEVAVWWFSDEDLDDHPIEHLGGLIGDTA